MNNYFGVDYYPEHWPKKRWETDIKLMQELGIDVVRMAEFSWSKLEPSEGNFNFGWLDEVIELLTEAGIKIILGTPTAAAPAWIINKNPEIQPIDYEGRRRHFGGRHHNCQSNLTYRNHIQRYVTAFAAHFGNHPNVIGWQIDNEFGNSHNELCYCSSCESFYREWLREKYGDIETLNQKWGTVFWSQDYSDFSHIQAPKLSAAGENPSAVLDWKRFCSDLIVDFHKFQSRILRAAAPGKFITHNLMGFYNKANYFDLSDDLEFVSHDQYPGDQHPGLKIYDRHGFKAHKIAAALDLMRGIKQKSFWMMEQQSNIPGWGVMARTPRPGEIGMWAMQCVAHGADTVVFFRWRTCTVGTEQYWHGILPHSGIPGRIYYELKETIGRAKPLMAEIQGTLPNARVAIVYSYDQMYAFEIQPHHPDLWYAEHVVKYYTAFFNRNVAVDFISDKMDFTKYDLVIAPLQYVMPSVLEEKYVDYVKNGGNLLLDMRAGVKDETNICRVDAPLPAGKLVELLGIEIHEYDCLRDTTVDVVWDGVKHKCEMWSDIITTKTAKALCSFDSEFYAGYPAVTLNSYGEGLAYYVGTQPGESFAAKIADELIRRHNLETFGSTPEAVEIVHRAGDDDYIFVINHTAETKHVDIPSDWKSYYQGQTDKIKPFGWDVYTRKRGV